MLNNCNKKHATLFRLGWTLPSNGRAVSGGAGPRRGSLQEPCRKPARQGSSGLLGLLPWANLSKEQSKATQTKGQILLHCFQRQKVPNIAKMYKILSKNFKKMSKCNKKTEKMYFVVKTTFEELHGPHQS